MVFWLAKKHALSIVEIQIAPAIFFYDNWLRDQLLQKGLLFCIIFTAETHFCLFVQNACNVFRIFTVTSDFGGAACQTLELIQGSMYLSEETPTVWIDGDCWPTNGEVVTKYPLCGASKLNVFVDCVKGQSTLTFGLISPHVRYFVIIIVD